MGAILLTAKSGSSMLRDLLILFEEAHFQARLVRREIAQGSHKNRREEQDRLPIPDTALPILPLAQQCKSVIRSKTHRGPGGHFESASSVSVRIGDMHPGAINAII
ncbi:ribosomal protein L22 [Perkinsela sp. CCAP 1560/4]|nr:hypothetical protein XU18_3150 [Perkinsela sp. CCAP 1560/4]KNH06743.1 ribosomal protein L22 [Perkinsela sp. CCAP 1560/4]|eukprot:KNH05873.1 hypothetical protein XU18_3150 [Perkinsela sp. CCAP 1560/4]